MNIGFISLGCSKNQVDTEVMMALIKKGGHRLVSKVEKADLVIINTCGFITDAKEEAIENIIDTGRLKEQGLVQYIIATGCLSQRYGKELLDEMPELDAVVGISSFLCINQVIDQVINGERVLMVAAPGNDFVEYGPRILTTPAGMAYLKIAEGCNNYCSYCTIPSIRGRLRSKPEPAIINEARELARQGIKEIVIIAQDTAAYGMDSGVSNLSDLLKKLELIDGIEWIRLMYLHPIHFNDEIIDTIACSQKVVPYLDIPVQHSADMVLKHMNRRHGTELLGKLINKLRSRIDGLALRTTVMVGFPGETEQEFSQLYEFIADTRFDWLGAFSFVSEEGTAAEKMPEQVDEEIKKYRREQILKLQQPITREKNIARLKTSQKVLVSTQASHNLYIGRSYFQAPEVDGVTLVKSDKPLKKGEFAEVVLKAVRNYDVIGTLKYDESSE